MEWQKFSENYNQQSSKFKTIDLPQHRVDIEYDATPIKAGEAYCQVWLVEMRLAKNVEWLKKRHPVVHSAIRFNHGLDSVTIPYLVQPDFPKDLSQENLDRVIVSNQPLTPLFPFNHGLVSLQVGLFSMIASDPIRKFITTLGRFTDLLPVPELARVLELAKPVYKGIEDLLGAGESKLELGYQQTFTEAGGGGANDLKAGYFAVILAEDDQIRDDWLCVVNDRLCTGSPGSTKTFIRDAKPLTGCSYMLFRLEKRIEQDWESLKSIKELVTKAQDRAANGKYEDVENYLIPSIRIAIYQSSDVSKNDRSVMIRKIEADLKEFGLQSVSSQRRSLYTIMQRPLPELDPETETALKALESLFEQ